MVARKSSGPLRPWRRLRASRTASLRDSGWRTRCSMASSSRVACMTSMSSGRGLRTERASASAPAVLDQAAPDLGLDGAAELLDAGLVLVGGQALLQVGQRAAGRARLGLRPSAAPARRRGRGSAACGRGSRCRRPGARAPCRRSGRRRCGPPRSSRPASADSSDLKSISASSSGVMPSPAAAALPRAPLPRRAARPGLLAVGLVAVGALAPRRSAPAGTAGPHGEEHLEGRLEGPPVRGRLHQRGGQRVLQRLAVLQRDVLDRLGRVEVLGQRDRAARSGAAR